MVISFINPENDLLLGEDELDIQGLNGVKELIVTGQADVYVTAHGIEISTNAIDWHDEIYFDRMDMRQPLFVRPTTSTEGKLTARKAQ